MKVVFTSLINGLKSLSLITVLILSVIFLFLRMHDEAADGLSHKIQSVLELSNHEVKSNDSEIYRMESASKIDISERDITPNYKEPKIELDVYGGTAYLRPSEIFCINGGIRPEIITIQGDTIATKSTLGSLYAKLSNYNDQLFRLKSHIINCKYVLMVGKESSNYSGRTRYQNIVKLDKNVTLNISEAKAKKLKSLMNYISI